ncbi:hypothetical protein QC762_111973 [Podospora pseudocomata]|uniref:Uncharacterized protein n=1 Tax=Podospora pseudocomata TaxID=2093779 RepID=A0ABR0GVC5_9PEZI|nr:hypothetical protein QC762_111973 [Podospora pseudocomata]
MSKMALDISPLVVRLPVSMSKRSVNTIIAHHLPRPQGLPHLIGYQICPSHGASQTKHITTATHLVPSFVNTIYMTITIYHLKDEI